MTIENCIVNTFHVKDNGDPTGIVDSARFQLDTGKITTSRGVRITTFSPDDPKKEPTSISPRPGSWADFAQVTNTSGVETLMLDQGQLQIAVLMDGPFRMSFRRDSVVHEISGINTSK
jgi:hypothetical protein